MEPRQKRKFTYQILTLSILILALAIILYSGVKSPRTDLVIRMGVDAHPNVTGVIRLHLDDFGISYELFYFSAEPISALHIKGPVAAGQTEGPLVFSLCGAPNLVNVCDVVSVPGLLTSGPSLLTQLEPGALSALPIINEIRANQHRYYLCVIGAVSGPGVCLWKIPLLSILGV